MSGKPTGPMRSRRPRQTMTFLRNSWRAVPDPWSIAAAVPPFPSRLLQPPVGHFKASPLFHYRLAFPSPGLGVMPSSQSTPVVAQPGLDTAASHLRSFAVLVSWALQETCHRSTPRGIRLAIAGHHASSLHLVMGPTDPSVSMSVASGGGGPLGWNCPKMPLVTAAPVGVGDTASSPPFLGGP